MSKEKLTELLSLLRTGRGLQVIAGLLFLVATIYAGFDNGGRIVEKLIGTTIDINQAVVSSPAYVFERWLVVAVTITIILNLFFYGTHAWSGATLLESSGGGPSKTTKIMFTALPLVSIFVGVIAPSVLLIWYLKAPNQIVYLEIATTILITLFAVYDIVNWLVGHLSPGNQAKEMKREARLLFCRVDVPIFISYVILLAFTLRSVDPALLAEGFARYSTSVSQGAEHAAFAFNSFTAGAAAFKLVISNLLFTVFMAEMLVSDYKNREELQGQSLAATVAAPNTVAPPGKKADKVQQGQAPAAGPEAPNDAAPPEQRTDQTSQDQASGAASAAAPPTK